MTIERRSKGGQKLTALEQRHFEATAPEKGIAYEVVKVKRRPGVVLGAPLSARRRKALGGSPAVRLVLPLYTADNFPPEFVARVQRFESREHFFLPRSPITDAIPTRDCIVRFERAHPIAQVRLDAEPVALVEPLLDQLAAWFMFFLLGVHNETSAELEELGRNSG